MLGTGGTTQPRDGAQRLPLSGKAQTGQVSQLLEAKPKSLVALGCRVTSLTPKNPLRLYRGGPGLSLLFPSPWPPGSLKKATFQPHLSAGSSTGMQSPDPQRNELMGMQKNERKSTRISPVIGARQALSGTEQQTLPTVLPKPHSPCETQQPISTSLPSCSRLSQGDIPPPTIPKTPAGLLTSGSCSSSSINSPCCHHSPLLCHPAPPRGLAAALPFLLSLYSAVFNCHSIAAWVSNEAPN